MPTPSAPSAEEALSHVLIAHARLRARSAELAREALQSARGELVHDVRGLVVDLYSIVAECEELEERELVPLLAEADAWGPVRVERLRERRAVHEHALLALADELVDGVPAPAEVMQNVQSVVECLLSDLDEEEATTLEPSSLRGDLIVIEQTRTEGRRQDPA